MSKLDVKLITIYKIKYNFMKKMILYLLAQFVLDCYNKITKVVKSNNAVRLGCRLQRKFYGR